MVACCVGAACSSNGDSHGVVVVSGDDGVDGGQRPAGALPKGVTGLRLLSSLEAAEARATCEALAMRLARGLEDTDWERLACTSIALALFQADAGGPALGSGN